MTDQNFLRPCVLAFAVEMEKKLRANDHKGGWEHDTPMALLRRLNDEATELHRAIENCNYENVKEEAADVANFAMMVADVSECFKGKLWPFIKSMKIQLAVPLPAWSKFLKQKTQVSGNLKPHAMTGQK